MKLKLVALAAATSLSLSAYAVTEVQWWHSMTAVNGEWVNDLAKGFNASQTSKSRRSVKWLLSEISIPRCRR